jgi:hypothetical protein
MVTMRLSTLLLTVATICIYVAVVVVAFAG